jgi:diacylglycerol kinase family enzyme
MDYLDGFRRLAERSSLFAGRDLRVVMIANPVAGGFTLAKRAAQNRKWLEDALDLAGGRDVLAKSSSGRLYETRSPGHAGEIAREVFLSALAEENPDAFYLVVIAGGDGTSLDIQTEYAKLFLAQGASRLPEKVCLLRLPFGTGNDGSDGRTLDQTLALLTGPARFERQRAVRVFPSLGKNGDQWFSFNIASVGIDAFITHMTNRVKRYFPGDFYKLWVDLACVFYGMAYTVGKMTAIMSSTEGPSPVSHGGRFLFALMGVSGHRTYGSNQKILPDDNNVCAIREMPIARKLALKNGIRPGKHAAYPETILCKADKMVLYYGERILLQLDGEARLLYPADFPLTMELTAPFITTIKPDTGAA